jgi:PAS domain-containing protein
VLGREALIRRNAQELRQLTELHQHAPVLVRDLHDRITIWNEGMRRLYGFTDGEALGRVSHELLQTASLGRWPTSMLEQAAIGVVQVEVGTGRFLRANARFCKMMGYAPEELLALSWPDLTPAGRHPELRRGDPRQPHPRPAGQPGGRRGDPERLPAGDRPDPAAAVLRAQPGDRAGIESLAKPLTPQALLTRARAVLDAGDRPGES